MHSVNKASFNQFHMPWAQALNYAGNIDCNLGGKRAFRHFSFSPACLFTGLLWLLKRVTGGETWLGVFIPLLRVYWFWLGVCNLPWETSSTPIKYILWISIKNNIEYTQSINSATLYITCIGTIEEDYYLQGYKTIGMPQVTFLPRFYYYFG